MQAVKKTWTVIKALMDSVIAILVALFSGLGMYLLGKYYTPFLELKYVGYALVFASAVSGWLMIKLFKEYRDRE